MNNIKYVLGSDSITVYLDNKPYAVNKQSSTFQLVVDAVKLGDEAKVRELVNVRQFISNALQIKSDKIRIDENTIWYGDREITGLVSTRIFETLRLGLSAQPFIKFIENLMENPSKRAVDELFGFLEVCELPLTDDGHFLAYKRVRNNYKDVHSGKFDNSVGQTLTMPRNEVDEDKDRTCSYGLHFCSYSYLSQFSGERIMVLKINPKDVVAIPSDYNNSKGRTCAYTVVDELPVNEYDSLPSRKLKDNYTTEYGGAFDEDGFDENGFDENGFDENGLDADGYDEDGFDDDGFDRAGFDENGYNAKGFDVNGNKEVVDTVLTKLGNALGFGTKLDETTRKAIYHAVVVRGDTLAEVARTFGVSARTVGRIRDGKR